MEKIGNAPANLLLHIKLHVLAEGAAAFAAGPGMTPASGQAPLVAVAGDVGSLNHFIHLIAKSFRPSVCLLKSDSPPQVPLFPSQNSLLPAPQILSWNCQL